MIKRLAVVPRIGLSLILMGLAVGLSLAALHEPTPVRAVAAATPAAGLRIIQSDEDRLVLELAVPEYAVQAAAAAPGHFQQIILDEASALAVPGRPELPKFSALIGIPAQGRVTVQVIQDDVQALPGRYQLLPARAPAPPAGDLQPGVTQHIPDRAAYASAELYPTEVARIVETAWLRDQRLARLELYPFQYRASTGTLVWHRYLRIEVRFEEGRTADRVVAAPALNDPFEPILQHDVLNYEVARRWRSPAAAPRTPARSEAVTPRYKIVVDQDGLYRVTYNDLVSAGLVMTSFDPRHLHVTNQGLDVAVEVTGEGDGQFDPDDALLFYGQRLRGDLLAAKHASEADHWLTLNGWQPEFNAAMVEKYTDDNVYWLEVSPTLGLRMFLVDGTPAGAPLAEYYTATVRAEQSKLWRTNTFTGEDTFFWEAVTTSGAPVTRTYPFTVSAVANTSFSATTRGEIVGWTYSHQVTPDHRTQFYLNNLVEPVEDQTWDGPTRHAFDGQFPATGLTPGMNSLKFVVRLQPGMVVDTIYFDWFEVAYPRRFQAEQGQLTFQSERTGATQYAVTQLTTPTLRVLDVSDPWRPQRVISSSVTGSNNVFTAAFELSRSVPATLVVSDDTTWQTPKTITFYDPADDLTSPFNGADYIIITPRAFYTGSQTLAAYRAAQGLRVKVVELEDVFNQFTDGLYHSIAIKDFLKYAYAHWQSPAPTYVLLVGDGHWNFKGDNVSTSQGLAGASPIYMPPHLAWVDPWQGEVDSSNALAAVSGADLLPDMLIGRMPVNNLAELAVIISKTMAYEQAERQPWQSRLTFIADNTPDASGDFVALSEKAINLYAPASMARDRLYLDDYCTTPSSTPCPAMNYAITNSLNLTGGLLVNYVGHASTNRWAHEQVLVNANVATLNNLTQLPVILSLTCLDGYWLHPITATQAGLMETLLRASNGGDVASFSPTGLGLATGHDVLQEGFYRALFANDAQRLGRAALAAKLELFAAGHDYDLIETFTVFGDPALRLPTYALAVSPINSVLFGVPNTVVMHTIQLTNTSFLTNTTFMSITGQAWPVTVSHTSLALPPGQTRSLLISVTVPATATLGASDVTTLTLRSASGESQTVVQLVTINGLYGATVAVDPVSQQADPGAVVTYTVQVTNAGALTDSFTLTSTGNSWLTQLSASNLPGLPPNGRAVFTATVSVPENEVAYSADVAHLVISSQGSLGFVNTIAPLTTTIKPVYGFEVAPWLLSGAGVSGQTLVYSVTLTNSGNATNTFAATVSGALWPTVVSPTSGSLAPWSSVNVPVRVSVPWGLGQGAVDTAAVTITLSLGGLAPDTVLITTVANQYQVVLPLIRK